jgi:hypothetical protein
MSGAPTPQAEGALELAALGYAVFPIYEPAAEGVCSCGCMHPHCWERAKHPRIPDREHAATTDRATVARWWRLWPSANVGIACRQSGIVVIDVDVDEDGRDRLPSLIARFGPAVTDTLVSRTGSGGWHLYFQAPQGLGLRTRKGWLGPGIDVQAYCTAPPSVHSTLGRFTWRDGVGPAHRLPAPLPWSLAERIAEQPGVRWYASMAPYWLADRAGLSMDTRQRVRRLQSLLRGPRGRH